MAAITGQYRGRLLKFIKKTITGDQLNVAAGHRMSNLWKTITGDQLTSEVGEWRHIKAGEFIAPGCYSTGTLQGGVV